jgi:hypothetical protein
MTTSANDTAMGYETMNMGYEPMDMGYEAQPMFIRSPRRSVSSYYSPSSSASLNSTPSSTSINSSPTTRRSSRRVSMTSSYIVQLMNELPDATRSPIKRRGSLTLSNATEQLPRAVQRSSGESFSKASVY